jgi:methylated-DNA-protein-cysteine methyltransferase related protein
MTDRPSPNQRESQAGSAANFYRLVYELVAQIPPGSVATYGQIARLLGHPSAARAVGYALHALATGSDIPWQRVVNASGGISSRCDPHYETIQRTLLEAEGVRFERRGTINLKTFRWPGPSPAERRDHHKPHQQQASHQPQDGRHLQTQGARVQAARQHGGELPAQKHARAGKQHGAQQHRALLAEGQQEGSMQAHQGRRHTRHKDHEHR